MMQRPRMSLTYLEGSLLYNHKNWRQCVPIWNQVSMVKLAFELSDRVPRGSHCITLNMHSNIIKCLQHSGVETGSSTSWIDSTHNNNRDVLCCHHKIYQLLSIWCGCEKSASHYRKSLCRHYFTRKTRKESKTEIPCNTVLSWDWNLIVKLALPFCSNFFNTCCVWSVSNVSQFSLTKPEICKLQFTCACSDMQSLMSYLIGAHMNDIKSWPPNKLIFIHYQTGLPQTTKQFTRDTCGSRLAFGSSTCSDLLKVEMNMLSPKEEKERLLLISRSHWGKIANGPTAMLFSPPTDDFPLGWMKPNPFYGSFSIGCFSAQGFYVEKDYNSTCRKKTTLSRNTIEGLEAS